MHPLTTFKEEQKELAQAIRGFKAARKLSYEGPSPQRPEWVERWGDLSLLYRIRHLAYCEARGRSREQIEPKVRDLDYANWYVYPKADSLKEELLAAIDKHYQGGEINEAA